MRAALPRVEQIETQRIQRREKAKVRVQEAEADVQLQERNAAYEAARVEECVGSINACAVSPRGKHHRRRGRGGSKQLVTLLYWNGSSYDKTKEAFMVQGGADLLVLWGDPHKATGLPRCGVEHWPPGLDPHGSVGTGVSDVS